MKTITTHGYTFEADVEKTREYYKNNTLCDCSCCRNYHSQINNYSKELTDFLSLFGIDIEKPDELSWIDIENEIDYIAMYTFNAKLIEHKINDVYNTSLTFDNGTLVFPFNSYAVLHVYIENDAKNSSHSMSFCAVLHYGDEEEESVHSSDFGHYNDFIMHVYEMINNIFNKKIKIIKYAKRFRQYGRIYYYLDDNNEWMEYEKFELKFALSTYYKETIYDFTLKNNEL